MKQTLLQALRHHALYGRKNSLTLSTFLLLPPLIMPIFSILHSRTILTISAKYQLAGIRAKAIFFSRVVSVLVFQPLYPHLLSLSHSIQTHTLLISLSLTSHQALSTSQSYPTRKPTLVLATGGKNSTLRLYAFLSRNTLNALQHKISATLFSFLLTESTHSVKK